MEMAKATIKQHSPPTATSIGIQIRRDIKAGVQSTAPESYFYQAMDYYARKYTNVHFFLASDDLPWCRLAFQNRSDITFLTGNAFEDMAVLNECEHSITSVGTYSWWSAWLAKGTVVYYTSTTRTLPNRFKEADYYPPHWIPMAGYEETLPSSPPSTSS
jgi:galactoside 2-L-fucosyltransferase 1/2